MLSKDWERVFRKCYDKLNSLSAATISSKLRNGIDDLLSCSIGCDQEGHFTFYRPRIIARGLKEGVSNDQMPLTSDKVDTTLADITFMNPKRTGFLMTMWMFESDNPNFLRDTWEEITQRIVSTVNARAEELRKIGVPDDYRYHMAFSETLPIMHLNMASGIGYDINTITSITPADFERTGALVLHELFHPVLWRFTHPALLESSNRPSLERFPLPNYASEPAENAWFHLGHVTITNAAYNKSEALWGLSFKANFRNLSVPILNQ